jgi:formamidopyrimidine-DNA glycosylase
VPELPELEVIKQRLEPLIVGKRIKELKILKPYVLKNYCSDDLNNESVEGFARRGKYLELQLTKHRLYVHLMLHGSIEYVQRPSKIKRSATALLLFDDGAAIELGERSTQKRMSLYVTARNEVLPRIKGLGVEPLSRGFTIQALTRLLKERRKQLKPFLCRQSLIAGIGSAYADEILWKARLSPFKISTSLELPDIAKLHNAIVEVLYWAIEQISVSRRLHERGFLRVHGRKGHPCPRCGQAIKTVSYAGGDTFYCPGCQTGGRGLKDRRMSRFYR